MCINTNTNWSKHFKLPILRGNDKIGIQIVTLGVIYQFDKSKCLNQYAPDQRNKEHNDNESTYLTHISMEKMRL